MHQQQRSSSDVLESGTRVENAAVGPKDTQPRGNAYAAEAFSGRDPVDRVDAAGNALTQPFALDLATGGFGGPAANTPTTGPVAGKARVRATEASPLATLRPSSEDQLVELLPADAPAQDALPVTKRFGSIDAPGSYEDLAPDTLFIGGRPHAEDVRQGSLGTCYLLADLLSVVNADPGHIVDMISLRGGVAMVLFHRWEEAAGSWVPAPVVVDTKLARDAGNLGSLVGAGFRVSEEPVSAAWHAEINENPDGNELAIWRRSIHEAALWAPIIEKAYARFAEMWGQFGGHSGHRDSEKRGGSGYDAIEGGYAAPVLRVLYGEAVEDERMDVNSGPRSRLAARNGPVITSLLSVSAGGTLATASIDAPKLPERLFELLWRAERASEIAPEVMAVCNAAMAAADIARISLDVASMVPSARALVDAVPADAGGELGRARDIALTVLTSGQTAGADRRSVYANHSYAVLGATFRGTDGEDLVLSSTDIPARIGEIDPVFSTVRVRNPHGEGEVARRGQGADDGVDDGAFELTLERFLTVFSEVDAGTRR